MAIYGLKYHTVEAEQFLGESIFGYSAVMVQGQPVILVIHEPGHMFALVGDWLVKISPAMDNLYPDNPPVNVHVVQDKLFRYLYTPLDAAH